MLPAVGSPLTTGDDDAGTTPALPPVPSDPAALQCFQHHESSCPSDRCSWLANTCCAATDYWCQKQGATTSGCTHFQDEVSAPAPAPAPAPPHPRTPASAPKASCAAE